MSNISAVALWIYKKNIQIAWQNKYIRIKSFINALQTDEA